MHVRWQADVDQVHIRIQSGVDIRKADDAVATQRGAPIIILIGQVGDGERVKRPICGQSLNSSLLTI